MSHDFAIRVQNLSKCYQVYERPHDRAKQFLFGKYKQFYKEFWALRDISFEIKKGEAFGIIGRNGSGKSTLLQLICQTLTATTGKVDVNGRIAALLELGAGFNPYLTGRENVYINGAILGFSRQEMDEKFADIAAFADIGDYIDQPVKNYSSGMFVRLAFAVQACVEPDILIVDEALSVGDIFFQLKCHARMEELLAKNTAIIFVTHDMTAIEKYCDQVILLNKGHCLFQGSPNEAVERYYQLDKPAASVTHQQEKSNPFAPVSSQIHIIDPKTSQVATGTAKNIIDWPSADKFLNLAEATMLGDETIARCTGVALCDIHGEATAAFELGDKAILYYEYELLQDIGVPIGGFIITDKMNINVHGKTTLQYLQQAPAFVKKGMRVRFRKVFELSITPGDYVFQVGLATISPEHYAQVTKLEHVHLETKMKEILRVRECGKFSVRQKNHGIRLPFYGCADLQGEADLCVIEEQS